MKSQKQIYKYKSQNKNPYEKHNKNQANTVSHPNINYNIKDCRNFLFNEYKNNGSLIVVSNENTNFTISNNNNINNKTTNNYNNTNNTNYTSNYSNKQLYEMLGKYHTRQDNNNAIIYFNDDNKYYLNNKKNNIYINNFQKSLIGFPNIGNTCYMNAFLQILLHTPNFLETLDKYEMKGFNNENLIYNLYFLSKNPYKSEYLKKIKDIMGEVDPKYGTFEPGDSQNFAIDFLDKLISESKNENSFDDSIISERDKNLKLSKLEKYLEFTNKYNNKNDPLEKLFQFVEISSVSNNLHSFSINLNIELDFPQSYVSKISLTKLLDNKYNKNKKLADLPEILIISFNRGIIGRKVIKTEVSYDKTLDVDPYMDKTLNNKLKSTNYILYGVNERYGLSKNQGHYICYIKIDYIWHYFSDLYVIQSNPDFNSPNVFGLYYVRSDCIKK